MKTKTRPAGRFYVPHCTYSRSVTRDGVIRLTDASGYVNNGANTIQYSTYPRPHPGAWPWQECHHQSAAYGSPLAAQIDWAYHTTRPTGSGSSIRERQQSFRLLDSNSLSDAPRGSWDRECLMSVYDQLDLNSRDNVLLYSGVVQAIPLLGSVLKLNSILRKIIRTTSKSFRRKPFTTVIKSLISADFIDRFVISPTLDDARRFQDACDYTLRVLQTAHDRNEHVFALRSKIRNLIEDTTSTRSYNNGNTYNARLTYRTQKYTVSQAFALIEARYDMTAVSPLKVWAQRVGLTRPLDSVWDLVPFSFVADYFFRGGDFISHLSDQMSSVDGLKAKVANVLDIWGTFERTTRRQCIAAHLDQAAVLPEGMAWDLAPKIKCMHSDRRNTVFQRFRVTDDPFSLLSSLSREENWGSLNLSLRATQKRTLAELFIQARLKS